MDKKIYILAMIALLNTLMLVNAQLIKNNFMDGINIGTPIEKGTYPSAGAIDILANQWNVFDRDLITANPPAPGSSPIAVAPLTYSGYIDSGKGNAFKLSKLSYGGRVTNYSLTDNADTYKGKAYYVAFLLNVEDASGADRISILSLNGNYNGGWARCAMTITHYAAGSYRLGVFDTNNWGSSTYMSSAYNYGETYLVVLKYNLPTKEISLFVNPPIAASEPIHTLLISPTGSTFSAIQGITVYQQPQFAATIGSLRFAESWEGALLLHTSVKTNYADYGKVIKEQYFNTLGVEIIKPVEKNIYIRVSTFENGKTASEKIIFTKEK